MLKLAFKNVNIFVLLFISFFAIFCSFWLIINYGNIDFSAIIFHLKMPYGANSYFIISFILASIVPSLVLSYLCFFKRIMPLIIIFVVFTLLVVLKYNYLGIVERIYKIKFALNYNLYPYIDYLYVFCGIVVALLLVYFMNRKFGKFIYKRSILFIMIIFVASLYSLQRQFDIVRFFTRDYSNFYEQNYVFYELPNNLEGFRIDTKDSIDSTLKTPIIPQTKRNIIIIFSESMESTYSNTANLLEPNLANGGGLHNLEYLDSNLNVESKIDSTNAESKMETKIDSKLKTSTLNSPQNLESNNLDSAIESTLQIKDKTAFKSLQNKTNLIPNLTSLANSHINFSTTDSFGGIMQVKNTSPTIAGTSSYMCGVPLNARIGNYFNMQNFLSSASCISDILHNLGYHQMALLGYDSRFAGSAGFFRTHHINAIDFHNFKEMLNINNDNLNDFSGFWGIKDSLVFDYAKKYLSQIDSTKPFALYIPTADTHFPEGYVDKDYCKGLDTTYNSAIKCNDKIISDFVFWVQRQDFYENTTIVIVGDHLSMKQNYFKENAPRFVFNIFINPSFSKNPSADLIKNRKLSHFDITALILDSLNIKTKAFGLGRNPLYQKTLLEIYGIEEFNKLITQDSRLYESLWKTRNKN